VAISWGIGLTLQRQRNAPPTSLSTPPAAATASARGRCRCLSLTAERTVLGLDPRAHSSAKLCPQREILNHTYARGESYMIV
jgi:hypothetical protein